MARIAYDHVTVRGEFLRIEIHYNQNQRFFYRGLPDEVYSLTDLGNRHYSSEAELSTALRNALVVFHEKIKQQRKVILYTLTASTSLISDPVERPGSTYHVPRPGISKKFKSSFEAHYLFGFSFDVLLEVNTGKADYFYLLKDGTAGRRMSSPMDSTRSIIEWTPQREQFFHDMAQQLQKLVNGVSAFFDSSDILELIDGGQTRLLGR